jgi:hypothetical protein
MFADNLRYSHIRFLLYVTWYTESAFHTEFVVTFVIYFQAEFQTSGPSGFFLMTVKLKADSTLQKVSRFLCYIS